MSQYGNASLPGRLWAKVSRSDDDECWPWLGWRDRDGYGRIQIAGQGSPTRRAHVVAHWLSIGPVGADELVCHSCDNPPCCNPAHLFLGTHADNVRDMYAKGRAVDNRGERSGHARVAAADVLAIRASYSRGEESLRALARRWGLGYSTVRAIVTRRTWGHI